MKKLLRLFRYSQVAVAIETFKKAHAIEPIVHKEMMKILNNTPKKYFDLSLDVLFEYFYRKALDKIENS